MPTASSKSREVTIGTSVGVSLGVLLIAVRLLLYLQVRKVSRDKSRFAEERQMLVEQLDSVGGLNSGVTAPMEQSHEIQQLNGTPVAELGTSSPTK